MSELEKMGRNLMDIALQYTHPNFEGMYPDWGAVCNIGEELVRMSDQSQLDENQQIVLEWLKESYAQSRGAGVIVIIYLLQKECAADTSESSYVREAYKYLTTAEEGIVVRMFAEWALEQEEE